MNEKELEQAIVQLSADPRFELFIGALSEMKERALAEAVANSAIGDVRISAAYLGEIRAYRDIISIYDEAVKRRQNQILTN